MPRRRVPPDELGADGRTARHRGRPAVALRHTLASHGITLDPAHAAQQYRLFTVSRGAFTSTAAVGSGGSPRQAMRRWNARREPSRTATRSDSCQECSDEGSRDDRGLSAPEFQDFARRSADAGYAGLVITESDARRISRVRRRLCLGGSRHRDRRGRRVSAQPEVTASVRGSWPTRPAAVSARDRSAVRAHVERRYSSEFDPPGPRMREYVLALRAIYARFAETSRSRSTASTTSSRCSRRCGRPASCAAPIRRSMSRPWNRGCCV